MSTSESKPTPSPDSSEEKDTSSAEASTPAELTAVVDDLLGSLSTKFASVSSEIFAKMDAMSKRLDQMEAMLQTNGGGRS